MADALRLECEIIRIEQSTVHPVHPSTNANTSLGYGIQGKFFVT